MNCFDEALQVINYIEKTIQENQDLGNHVTSENIDMSAIAKITGVPSGLYQRIFSYICGISITEYVRKRKLSLAACEILHNKSSVIQIAMKYGYESHSAFTRAFKEQFGVPPVGLTKEILDAGFYPPFSFQVGSESYYVMKGRRIMADIVKIEYEEMEERLLIGIAKSVVGGDAPQIWGRFFEEGYADKLNKLEMYECEDMKEDYIGLGYATDFPDDKSLGNEYIVGRYFKLGTPVPENMVSRIIPKGIIAKAQIKGKNLDDIIYNAYILIKDMCKKNGYKIDYNHFYWTEVYTIRRYVEPLEKGSSEIILDWFMPCIKECE